MSKHTHHDRMKKVARFIEDNLNADINVGKLSDIACYSEFHFHRLFHAYIGESVYAYRKRLLLERSIKHLIYSDQHLTDIAAQCGYENQASFNKAFKNQFSCTPGQVKNKEVSLDSFTAEPSHTWSNQMKPEIIEMEAINVISARAKGSYGNAAAEAWGKIMKFGYSNKLMAKVTKRIGIAHDDPSITSPDHIRYDACIDVDANIEEQDSLIKQVIKGGTYAKFIHKGSYEKLSNTYAQIFNAWLPESGFTLRDEPCFESYLNKDPRKTKPENLRTEIYIPVRR